MAEKKALTRRQFLQLQEAGMQVHRTEPAWVHAANVDFIIYLVTMLLVLFSVRAFVGEPLRVDGISMHDTLVDGERMVVEKMTYLVDEPARGDIIVCHSDLLGQVVKRVIGLPGETIQVVGGVTYINGEPYQENYILEPMSPWRDMPFPATVPEGSVFVMGDNRNDSVDSRIERVGCIPYHDIFGRVIGVMWPPSRIRGVN